MTSELWSLVLTIWMIAMVFWTICYLNGTTILHKIYIELNTSTLLSRTMLIVVCWDAVQCAIQSCNPPRGSQPWGNCASPTLYFQYYPIATWWAKGQEPIPNLNLNFRLRGVWSDPLQERSMSADNGWDRLIFATKHRLNSSELCAHSRKSSWVLGLTVCFNSDFG